MYQGVQFALQEPVEGDRGGPFAWGANSCAGEAFLLTFGDIICGFGANYRGELAKC